MPRRPKPDPEPYLRLILGVSMNKRQLTTYEMDRLSLAVAITGFIATKSPTRREMSAFIKKYASENGVTPSFCYKIKAKLEELTLIKFDDHWHEYRLNMERWKRDKKALASFKEQTRAWLRKVA